MDPNEVRLRLIRDQQPTSSHAHSVHGPVAADHSHGGDMDPNEVRLRLAQMQQTSSSPSPTMSNPAPNNTVTSHGGYTMQRTDLQPAHYGSSSHLINTPSSPPYVSNMYQTAQSPQSGHSGGYFPTQHPHQASVTSQAQGPSQSPYSNLPAQVSGWHSPGRSELTSLGKLKQS